MNDVCLIGELQQTVLAKDKEGSKEEYSNLVVKVKRNYQSDNSQFDFINVNFDKSFNNIIKDCTPGTNIVLNGYLGTRNLVQQGLSVNEVYATSIKFI